MCQCCAAGIFIGVASLLFIVDGKSSAIWAVNCGGSFHEDVNGVEYIADPLDVGISSDFGTKFASINRVPEEDQILYQTERYNTDDFSYEFPRPADGHYVLTLKFSEVWFENPGGKVFDVSINKEIPVIVDLDICGIVGFLAAHDEYIPISIKNDVLKVGDKSMEIKGQKSVSIDFLKGKRDNPKINAIVLYEGTLDDVPKLSPLLVPQHATEPQEEPVKQSSTSKPSRPFPISAPSVPDPYSSMDTYILPVTVGLATLLPIFCLCKL